MPGKQKSRFWSREVLGIVCLSMLSICATVLLVWACLARGNCEHWGTDTCQSRTTRGGFQGNADFHGLGIRLGIYFQWLASLFANTLLGEDVRRTITIPYVGFQVAVLAALLLLVFRSDCTFTAEVVVVLYILLGGVFIVLAPELIQSFRHVKWTAEDKPKYRLFHTFVWIIVGWVMPVAAWFWIRLATIDAGKADFYRTPGGTSIFLLAHVKDEGLKTASVFMALGSLLLAGFAFEKVAFAAVYKVLGFEFQHLALLMLEYLAGVFIVSLSLLKARTVHIITAMREDASKSIRECVLESCNVHVTLSLDDLSHDLSSWMTLGRPEIFVRLYSFVIAMISMAISICAVELTLAWNHVSGVDSLVSTGQIVPLFVGMATFASVMWELVRKIQRKPVGCERNYDDNKSNLFDIEVGMWQSGDTLSSKPELSEKTDINC